MSWLSDKIVHRLRSVANLPDLGDAKYRVLQQLARGGMGTVYLAEDTTLGRKVALKVLDFPDSSGELAARMLREARIVARLEHPGIVPVHDVGRTPDGRIFYAMKFVQGNRLDQHLDSVPSLADRLRIFQKICEAVAFAHAHGVLHRDLKPENIMVGPFGEVLVMDWGVAKVRDASVEGAEGELEDGSDQSRASGQAPTQAVMALRSNGTAHGAILGTPGYMAPEQARGEIARLDERSDVFALGAILRFLLTGCSPEDVTTAATRGALGTGEPSPPRFDNGTPKALAAICRKAMSYDPGGRYGTAEELAADVARYLDGLPVVAYPESLFAKLGRVASKHRLWIILILAYLLMRIVLLLWVKR